MKFYAVTAKCGHVGRGYYIPIEFALKAESKTDAAKRVRNFPRVKHHHKDAILFCREITEMEYNEINERNQNDKYLLCHSSTEQKRTCNLENRIVIETQRETVNNRKERVALILKKRRIIENECLRQCQALS